MCEARIYYPGFANAMRGRSVNDLFPANVTIKVPYQSVLPGHCLMCKQPLGQHEMFPPGRCSRPMCEGCYQVNVSGTRGTVMKI
jgi:hypothetical protein